jgi:hypothetical protein
MTLSPPHPTTQIQAYEGAFKPPRKGRHTRVRSDPGSKRNYYYKQQTRSVVRGERERLVLTRIPGCRVRGRRRRARRRAWGGRATPSCARRRRARRPRRRWRRRGRGGERRRARGTAPWLSSPRWLGFEGSQLRRSGGGNGSRLACSLASSTGNSPAAPGRDAACEAARGARHAGPRLVSACAACYCVIGFAFQFQQPKRRREFLCLIISEKKYDMTK